MANTEQAFRDRFHEAHDEEVKIRAASAPLHVEADAIREQIKPLEAALAAKAAEIKAVEAPLFDLQNEKASLVRALKGKTGYRCEKTGVIVLPDSERAKAETEASQKNAAAEAQV